MVTEQNQIIEEKNHEIIDSIKYAKIIQEAILPKNSLKEEFSETISKNVFKNRFLKKVFKAKFSKQVLKKKFSKKCS